MFSCFFSHFFLRKFFTSPSLEGRSEYTDLKYANLDSKTTKDLFPSFPYDRQFQQEIQKKQSKFVGRFHATCNISEFSCFFSKKCLHAFMHTCILQVQSTRFTSVLRSTKGAKFSSGFTCPEKQIMHNQLANKKLNVVMPLLS